MELHTDCAHIPGNARGCVLAVGNFDGLHLGHRALIARARDIAKAAGAPLGVLTFEPHPRRFFRPADPPFRLTPLPAKRRRLEMLGLDHLFALPFDAALADMTGEDFVSRILEDALGADHVVVGRGFRFGRNRSGTAETLQNRAFGLTLMEPVEAGGEVCSSTRIRALLQQGALGAAAALLGAPFEMEGPVIPGDRRGREIGTPTANQAAGDYLRLNYGIYAVRAALNGDPRRLSGVSSFGLRPMFALAEPLLETHLFDFNEDIYGKNLRVTPVAYLRPEMNFSDIEALKDRIRQDCADAKAALAQNPERLETR